MSGHQPQKAVLVEHAGHIGALVVVPGTFCPSMVDCFGCHGFLEAHLITYDVWATHPCCAHSGVVSLPCMVDGISGVAPRCLLVHWFVSVYGGACVLNSFALATREGLCSFCIWFWTGFLLNNFLLY